MVGRRTITPSTAVGARAGDAGLAPAMRALAALVLCIGGAGTGYPWVSTLIAISGIAVLAYLAGSHRARPRHNHPGMTAVAIGILVFPLLQLVPLPPALWRVLPGREGAALLGEVAGLGTIWRPISLDPAATLSAWLMLLAPAAGYFGTRRLSSDARLALLRTIVVIACASVVLAAMQVAGGQANGFTLWATAHQGLGVGLFTNRNHQAMFLLCAIALLSVPGLAGSTRTHATGAVAGQQLLIASALLVLLSVGVIATLSRTGLVLLPAVLAFAAWRVFVPRADVRSAAMCAVVLTAATLILLQTAPVAAVFARFAGLGDDQRFAFWRNTATLIRNFLPWGSGFGTFVTLYGSVQPLDELGVLIPNHAHSDWLELLLEGGIPAALLVAIATALLVVTIAREARRAHDGRARSIVLAAAAVLLIMAIGSLDDYPLRTGTNLFVFAVAAALLTPTGRVRRRRAAFVNTGEARRGKTPGTGTRVAVLAAGIGAAVGVAANGAGATLILEGRYGAATRVAPWAGAAWSGAASRLLTRGDDAGAQQAAWEALRLTPLDMVAMRTLGLAAAQRGDDAAADRLMTLAGARGWVDQPTQLWLLQRAVQLGDAPVAVARADAVLRREQVPGTVIFPILTKLAHQRSAAVTLAARLAARPAWRASYLSYLGSIAPADFDAAADVLVALRSAGSPATRGESRPLLNIIASQSIERAWRLWQALGHRAPVTDGDFAGPIGQLAAGGPFEWRATGLLGASLAIEQVPGARGGGALSVQSRGLASGEAIVQRLLLAPGRYRLIVRIGGADADSPPPDWVLACGADVRSPIALNYQARPGREKATWRRGEGTFAVREGCATQRLALVLANTDGRDRTWWVDAVTIGRAP